MLFVIIDKDRKTSGYEMDPTKTVLDLKHAISARTDDEVDAFRLSATIGGRAVQLEDSKTLESYGLNEETPIRIVGNSGGPKARIVALR
jgi:hypothetical protein